MADAVTVEVKGLAEIGRALKQLPVQVQDKAGFVSLLAGAKVIRDKAKELAPVLKVPSPHRLAGVLKRNVRMARARRPAPGMTLTAIVGVRKLSKAQVRKVQKLARSQGKRIRGADIVGNPFYWRFMEFGFTDRAGVWHGPHGGRGFLRGAFNDTKDVALGATTRTLKQRTDAAITKLGFRAK